MGNAMSGQSGVRSSLIRPKITVLKIFCWDDKLFPRMMEFLMLNWKNETKR
jgi:hypothetical protein